MQTILSKNLGRKRKKFLLAILFFLLLVLAVVFFLRSDLEEGYRMVFLGGYRELYEFCEIEIGEVETRRECEVFLKDFRENVEGKKSCMLILLPVEDVSEREVEVCIKGEEIIEWTNPYNNYDLPIPVIISMEYEKVLLGIGYGKLRKIAIELMDDSRANELTRFDNPNAEPIRFRSHHIEEMNKIANRGYYITSGPDSEKLSSYNLLGVIDTKVTSFFVAEDGEMILNVVMYMAGQEIKEQVVSSGFKIFRHTDNGIYLIKEVVSGSDMFEFLRLDANYQMQVRVEDYDECDELLIEEYLEGNPNNLRFVLISLIERVDN